MLNCRKCPIRNRCIEESVHATSIRMMLYHAFENKTDTLATWGRLNTHCLIAKYRRDETKNFDNTSDGGALSKRLVQAREQKVSQPVSERTGRVARANGYVGAEEVDRRLGRGNLPVDSLEKHYLTGLRPISQSEAAESDAYWLTIEDSWRHIWLPQDGTLVLGHFDPSVGVPPDVDLAFEDRKQPSISRRHAVIAGKNGQYSVEDLGSVAGTFLNGEKLGFRPSRSLKAGDRITVGQINMVYDRVPPVVLNAGTQEWTRHILMMAATGRKFQLTPQQPVIIGRSDARIEYTPDIDLLPFGQIAQRVSRRHARLEWHNGRLHVEDMGSGFGTRLRGGLLPLGQSQPLMPGDHIWLAGLVLVYDIQVRKVVTARPVQPGEMQPAEPQFAYR